MPGGAAAGGAAGYGPAVRPVRVGALRHEPDLLGAVPPGAASAVGRRLNALYPWRAAVRDPDASVAGGFRGESAAPPGRGGGLQRGCVRPRRQAPREGAVISVYQINFSTP